MVEIKKTNLTKEKITKFAQSYWLFLIVGVITLIGHFFALDIPTFVVLGAGLIFLVLYVDDSKPMLPFIFCFWHVVSIKNGATTSGSGYDYTYYSSPEVIWTLLVLCSFGFVAFVIRFFVLEKNKKEKLKTPLLVTMTFLTIALLLNGIDVYSWLDEAVSVGYGTNYDIINLVFALLQIFIWILMFFYFRVTMKHDKNSIVYFFHSTMLGASVIMIQLFVRMIEQAIAGVLFVGDTLQINRAQIALGWGMCNNIGNMLVVTLVGTIYLAITQKKSWFYWLFGALTVFSIFVTQCRGAVAGVAVLALCTIVLLFVRAKNKKTWIISALVCFAVGVVSLVAFGDTFKQLFARIFNNGLSSSNRLQIWLDGLEGFIHAPLFGQGFVFDVPFVSSETVFHNLFHNLVIQLLAATGLVGFCAFLLFRIEIFKLAFKKITTEKAFLLFGVIIVDVLSMFDNNLFYPIEGIFVTLCLVLCNFEHEHGLVKETKEIKNEKV